MWSNESFGGGGGGRAGGGGFVPNDGSFNSPAGDKGQSRVKRSTNIFPVTIKQLLEAQDEALKIMDTEVSVVSIVGLVKKVETSSTKISYIIDDMTGCIEAHTYTGTDDNVAPPFVLSENTYGRIIGSLRTAKGGGGTSNKYILMFKCFPVLDLNEVTSHGLEILRIPLKMNKLKEYQALKTGVGANNSNALGSSMIGGTVGGDTSTNNGASFGTQNLSGLTANQNMVFRCISSVKGDEGVHVDQVIQNLKNKMSDKDVKAAVEFLSSEGHIYSTVDDEHYKCTEW